MEKKSGADELFKRAGMHMGFEFNLLFKISTVKTFPNFAKLNAPIVLQVWSFEQHVISTHVTSIYVQVTSQDSIQQAPPTSNHIIQMVSEKQPPAEKISMENDDFFGDQEDNGLTNEQERQQREIEALRRRHYTAGLREGANEARENHVQSGFDEGFLQGAKAAALPAYL